MKNLEQVTETLVLLDVDGTTSDTARHMEGLNQRLAEAFPEVGAVLPNIVERRQEFRQEYRHLSFVEQDKVWQELYPGTTSHSQLDIYRSLAPEVFDEPTTRAVSGWLQKPRNFGHGEYEDVQPAVMTLRRMGALVVSFTLGQRKTPEGDLGWQELKLASAPTLRTLRSHIADTLPEGGKGQVIAESQCPDCGLYCFPMTDGGPDILAKNIVMVDDSLHNMQLPPQARGMLMDRTDKYSAERLPLNVSIIRSLVEVSELIDT